MSSSSMPAAALRRPEEPTVDVFLGDVVERPVKKRQAAGGGKANDALRPIAPMPSGLGFPVVDPNKSYGLRPEVQPAGSSSSGGAQQPMVLASSIAPPSGVRSMVDDNTAAQSTAAVGAADLAAMHSSSFYRGVSYPLPPSMAYPRQPNEKGGEGGAAAAASATPVGTQSAQSVVHEGAFVELVVKVLQSTIPHHRMMALDVLLREFQRATHDDVPAGAAAPHIQGCQNYFLFGPHCATRIRVLVECLSRAAPKEAVKILEVLSSLCAATSNTARDIADATSELSVPLADVSVQQENHLDSDGTDDEAVSEQLRLDLPRGLATLGLPHTILHVGISPEQWPSVAAVSAPEARRIFWQLLTTCAAVPLIAVAFATHRFLRSAIASTIESVLLGDDDIHSPATMALLRCLRQLCHVRPAAIALADMLRPLLKLLLGLLVDAEAKRPSPLSHLHQGPSAQNDGNDRPDDHDDDDAAANRVVVTMHLCLILRNFVRHGCNGIVVQFGPEMVALTNHGSLGVLEMVLLTDDGNGSKGLSTASLDMLAQQAFRGLYSPGDGGNGGGGALSEGRAAKQLLLRSTTLQFWATYLGCEGIKALGFLGAAAEVQTVVQKLLASHLMTADALSKLFPTPQQRRSHVGHGGRHHSGGGGGGGACSAVSTAAVAVNAALQISMSYNLVRFLVSVQRVLPATRTAVVGFLDAAAVRLVDVMFSGHEQRAFRKAERAAAFNNRDHHDSLALHVAGGQVLHAPLTIEELSMAMEVIECLSENGGGSRVGAAVGCIVLDVMAKTKQCNDGAPLVAKWLLAASRPRGGGGGGDGTATHKEETDVDEEDAADIARAVVGDGGTAAAADPATSTAGWMTALLSVARRLSVCAQILKHAVTCHPAARYAFHWESLFVDLVVWSVSPPAASAAVRDPMGSEAVFEAMLALCRVALTEGHVLSTGPAHHIATTLSTYANAVEERRLPLCAVAGISAAILVLPPEGCLACLRMLNEAHETFAWTRPPQPRRDLDGQRNDGASGAARSDAAKGLVSSTTAQYFDVLFQQVGPAAAGTHAAGASHGGQRGVSGSSPWALQHIVDCLQTAIPLHRRWAQDSWPRLAVCALVDRLVLKSRGASEFERLCVEELLGDMNWRGGQKEQVERTRGVEDNDDDGWVVADGLDDEFEFS